MTNKIKASCTWGDGPDILLILDGKRLMCYHDPSGFTIAKHGFVSRGSAELTQQEARELAVSLIQAADACKALEDSYEDYVANGGDTKTQTFKVQIPEKE